MGVEGVRIGATHGARNPVGLRVAAFGDECGYTCRTEEVVAVGGNGNI